MGVHALVWVGGWSPDEARHAIASTAEAGYDLIEIPLLDPSSAEREGVTIGLEVVNRYESNVLNTTELGLRFLDDIGAPNATLHLDTYRMNIEEKGTAAAIEPAGDRIGYFHVGESDRGPLGSGTVDFAETFAALDRLGYDVTITFESFSSAVVSPALTRALCIWGETWDDGMELAVSARRFVLEHLAAATA